MKLGIVQLLVEEENKVYENEITEKPVESGVSISDNSTRKPPLINIAGIVNDNDTEFKRKVLKKYRELSTKLVYNGIDVVDNVVIKTLDITDDSSIKNGFKFSITLQVVSIVELEKTTTKMKKYIAPDTSQGKTTIASANISSQTEEDFKDIMRAKKDFYNEKKRKEDYAKYRRSRQRKFFSPMPKDIANNDVITDHSLEILQRYKL